MTEKEPRTCKNLKCNKVFLPKRMGGKALYCSRKCKNGRKREYSIEQKQKWRKNSYNQIRLDPKLYQDYLNSGNKSAKKVRLWLYNYKLEHGCMDCGYKGHPAALQLDHNGPKAGNIGEFRGSISRMKHEIEVGNCVVRCANCHLVKTWANKNNIKYNPNMVYAFESVIPETESSEFTITDRFGFQKFIEDNKKVNETR